MKGQELRKSCQWSQSEQEMHINYVCRSTGSISGNLYFSRQRNMNIPVRTDNISASAYINHFGGTHSWQMKFISNADMEVVCRVTDFPNNTTPSRGRMQLLDLLLDTCHLLFG